MKATISFVLALFVMLCTSMASAQEQGKEFDIEVDVEKRGASTVFHVDGKEVERPELLQHFSIVRPGVDLRTLRTRVVMSSQLTLGDFSEVRGLLGKAGIVDATYYSASDRTGRMVEIKAIGAAIPRPQMYRQDTNH